MTILIVDDEEEYLQYLARAVSQDGHKPLLAATGLAARMIIEGGGVSLLLTDLRLPDVSGLSLMNLARKIDPLTVCVATTAFASEESAVEALRLGAYDYLPKPSGVDVIKATVSRALEHYRLEKTLLERTAEMERLKAEDRQAAGTLNQFSHQLRNSLSLVFGCAALLTDEEASNLRSEDMQMSLQMIRKGASQMRDILNQAPDAA